MSVLTKTMKFAILGTIVSGLYSGHSMAAYECTAKLTEIVPVVMYELNLSEDMEAIDVAKKIQKEGMSSELVKKEIIYTPKYFDGDVTKLDSNGIIGLSIQGVVGYTMLFTKERLVYKHHFIMNNDCQIEQGNSSCNLSISGIEAGSPYENRGMFFDMNSAPHFKDSQEGKRQKYLSSFEATKRSGSDLIELSASVTRESKSSFVAPGELKHTGSRTKTKAFVELNSKTFKTSASGTFRLSEKYFEFAYGHDLEVECKKSSI